MAAVYADEVKLFGKWSYDELVCEDISLTVRSRRYAPAMASACRVSVC